MGAWIETSYEYYWRTNVMSHPTWVRGLKPVRVFAPDKNIPSHPTWVRGLKLQSWNLLRVLLCRTLHGCVD